MSVLSFNCATLKDGEAFKAYVQKAAVLMAEAGVEVVLRANYEATLRGDGKPPHIAAVFRYPDREAAEAFYAADRYQDLVPLRDRACDMTIHLYNE